MSFVRSFFFSLYLKFFVVQSFEIDARRVFVLLNFLFKAKQRRKKFVSSFFVTFFFLLRFQRFVGPKFVDAKQKWGWEWHDLYAHENGSRKSWRQKRNFYQLMSIEWRNPSSSLREIQFLSKRLDQIVNRIFRIVNFGNLFNEFLLRLDILDQFENEFQRLNGRVRLSSSSKTKIEFSKDLFFFYRIFRFEMISFVSKMFDVVFHRFTFSFPILKKNVWFRRRCVFFSSSLHSRCSFVDHFLFSNLRFVVEVDRVRFDFVSLLLHCFHIEDERSKILVEAKRKEKKSSKNRQNFLLHRLNATRIRDNDHRKSKRKEEKPRGTNVFFDFLREVFLRIDFVDHWSSKNRENQRKWSRFFVNFTRSASENRRVKLLNEFFNSKFWLFSN